MSFKGLFWLTKKCRIIAFIFSIFINLIGYKTCFCQSYPYKFKYLTVDEGLSHTDANYIVQDDKGYLWIATNFGLDRFDGYVVKKYYNNNAPIKNAQKNRILCSYPDKSGKIWLGTEDGLQYFDPSTEKYVDFNNSQQKPNPVFYKLLKPSDDLIYGLADNQLKAYSIKDRSLRLQHIVVPRGLLFFDMAADRYGNTYLASNFGLWILAKNSVLQKIDIYGFTAAKISNLSFDNKNRLAFASGNQVLLTNGLTAMIRPRSLAVYKRFISTDNTYINQITTDKRNNYWLNTGSNVIELDTNLNFMQTISNKSSQYGLNSTMLLDIFVDRSQCLWICTAGGGLNYCDLNQKLFYTLQHDPYDPNSLSGNHIGSVLEDGRNLWVGTQANGLNCYNFDTRLFTLYNSSNTPVKLKSDAITALTLDRDHNLWVGSQGGIDILKPGRKQLWRPPGYGKFPTYWIECIAEDCYGNMWFGNHNKLGVIWKDKKNYYRVKEYTEGHFILPDKNKPLLFVSSRHGLKKLTIDKEGNIIKTVYYNASLNPNSLSSSYISPICKQNDSTYWIGTIGGGLNKISFGAEGNRYIIKSFANNYGIFNDVEALEIDQSGKLWLGGNALICFDPVTGNLIRYEKSDGLQGNSFKVRASYKGTSGRLYFGGINGLNYFYPEQIKINKIDARPVITGILINNQQPNYDQANSEKNYIGKAIGYNNNLKLTYLQNNFTISFSAMHYANPVKCKYRYQLVGFDNYWHYTDGKNSSAAYNNLDYKAYTFVVEASNNDGIWSKTPAEVSFIITPPWWRSMVAKIIYGLLFFCALFAIYVYQARWYRLKNEIELRTLNENKREEMHQQQLLFFTNISHEFRTPLALILGPLEKMITQNRNTALDHPYQLIFRNAQRLTNLISELMNFKKVSDSLIKLQVRPLMVDQFCENLAQDFQSLADKNNISFRLTIPIDKNASLPISGLFDAQVLEKIIFNLLSNAFKYTPEGGQVSFELLANPSNLKLIFGTDFKLLNDWRAKKYMYFRIVDSGIGISPESISRIFDRYYRVSNDHLGSGVGLALVKSLTLLHKGDIYISSERHKGTEVVIGIPWGEENYTNQEIASAANLLEPRLETIDHSILLPVKKQVVNLDDCRSKSNKHILIVDDNDELRLFLKETFAAFYPVYEAGDGQIALEIAKEKLPDLIISDVMMPGMDGIELCREIKGKDKTKHIPFIILSAKDALTAKIEGLESGADFYFAKPVSLELLLLTVKNFFEQGENVKLRFTNDYLSEATKNLNSDKEKQFAERLLTVIEQNISNPDLNVDFLCNKLYTSRTKLYQQIKKISDQPVGDFIRRIRLKKAIHLMTHEDVTMGEIAERIGLQNSANLSRTFKKEYGKSPSQFIQALKNTAPIS